MIVDFGDDEVAEDYADADPDTYVLLEDRAVPILQDARERVRNSFRAEVDLRARLKEKALTVLGNEARKGEHVVLLRLAEESTLRYTKLSQIACQLTTIINKKEEKKKHD